MFRQSALEAEVPDEGSEHIRAIGRAGLGADVGLVGNLKRWSGFHRERDTVIDYKLRTHVCTVAGNCRAVKYQAPDAPNAAD